MKKKFINTLLSLTIIFSLSSCIKFDSNYNSTKSYFTSSSIEDEVYDYILLTDNAILYYGMSYGRIKITYKSSEKVAPLNEFFKDLKFIEYKESRDEMPAPNSLNVESKFNSDMNIHYEVTDSGEVFLKNHDLGNIFFLATSKVDYVAFFKLFYAEAYSMIQINRNF